MSKPFIVAELSANHLGSLERALHIIDAAAHAGASAVKFQTWQQDTMVIDKGYRLDSGPWAGRLLHELYAEAYTPWEWHQTLYAAVRSHNMVPFSSVFDCASVDFLETLDCPIYKIASFEITDIPLIKHAGTTGKPMMISTGMATHDEIQRAAAAAVMAGCPDLTLLKCTSAYPAKHEDMNLEAMEDLAIMPYGYDSGTKIGLSDHSRGIAVPVAAVALGAEVIEKHLTLARGDGGPDAAFSLEPDEFRAMVDACCQARLSLGVPGFGLTPAENPALDLRRSLFWVDALPGDATAKRSHMASARPGLGIPPSMWGMVENRKLKQPVTAGMPVLLEQFE